MLAMGVLLAAMERMKSGKGQVIDVAMTEGANYVALPLFRRALWMPFKFKRKSLECKRYLTQIVPFSSWRWFDYFLWKHIEH